MTGFLGGSGRFGGESPRISVRHISELNFLLLLLLLEFGERGFIGHQTFDHFFLFSELLVFPLFL